MSHYRVRRQPSAVANGLFPARIPQTGGYPEATGEALEIAALGKGYDDAEYRDGLLRITAPIAPEPQPTTVDVHAG